MTLDAIIYSVAGLPVSCWYDVASASVVQKLVKIRSRSLGIGAQAIHVISIMRAMWVEKFSKEVRMSR